MNLQELHKYDESKPVSEQKYVRITKIVVPTNEDKQQLLAAFRYIHDLHEIDTDIMAVNTLAHMYLAEDLIEVEHENCY
jgi:hypothetical protein